jgi:ABC-type branched-subunit amino acid transport system substrate-binding protein
MPSPTPENTPELSGETVVVFHLCDASGSLGEGNASRILAVEQAVNAINEGGGIFGAELDLRFVDTKGAAAEAQAALARLIRQHGEPPLVLICDPATEAELAAQIAEDDLVAFGPAAHARRSGPIFGVDATPQEHAAFALETLAANWATLKPEGAGDEIRIAVISWPADLAGVVDIEALLDEEEPAANIVMQADLPADHDANAFDLVYAARDANANVIFTTARSHGLAALLNVLNVLALADRFTVIAPAASYDAQTIDFLADPEYASGLYLSSTWAWWGEGGLAIEAAEALGPGDEFRDWGYLQMAAAVDLARHSLEAAILEGGFESLSPATVLDALRGMQAYPALDGVFTADYSGGIRSLGELRLWQVGDEPNMLILAE